MSGAAFDGPRLAPAAGGRPRQIVLLLHGYGSNGRDMIALAPVWCAALPHALFVAPNAPQRCPGAPGGYQWWGLESVSRSDLARGVARAAPGAQAAIDALLAEHGLDAGALLLVGFSQGAMLALHLGLERVPPVAGIVGYSGLLADPLHSGAKARPPVLLVHGEADPTVPVAGMRQSANELRRMGVPVEAITRPGLGHSVDADGLARGLAFARRVWAAAGSETEVGR